MTVRAMRVLVGVARDMGEDPSPALERLRISAATMLNGESRIAHEHVAAFWSWAAKRFGEDALFVRAVQALDFTSVTLAPWETEYVPAQLFTTSATVGEGMRAYGRVYPLLHDGVSVEIGHEPDLVRVRLLPSPGLDWPPGLSAWLLAMGARLALASAARPLPSLRVRLARPKPADARAIESALGAPVSFGAASEDLELSADDFDAPLKSARAELHDKLLRRGAEALASFAPERAFANRARDVVRSMLVDGAPAERVAAALGTSVRTLARRLEASGTSLRTLVDEARIEVAHRALLDERTSHDELAHRLGFSNSPAFYRAFRRWFGCAPSEYRRGRSAAAGPE